MFNEIQISKGKSMTIRQQLKKYNSETHKREVYLDNVEFHSLQEIKDYCIDEMNKLSCRHDMVVFNFIIMDTEEQITIVAQMIEDIDGLCCPELQYGF